MFKKPRKTCHSDSRTSYELIHDEIMKRLGEDEQAEYLNDIIPVLEKVDTLSQVEARKMYFRLSKHWMNPEEVKAFIDEKDLHVLDSSWCKICEKRTGVVLDETEASLTCEQCGWSRSYIGPSSDKYLPWDFEAPASPCPYKRSNHFNEYLDSFMARHCGSLPDEIFETIYKELKKQRVSDYSTLTIKRMRSIMKSVKLNKYYESAPFILYRIKGEKPPDITPAIEQELKANFDLIQEPFERVVKEIAPERKNFLSYSYTIFKMLQLMELDYLLDYFTLLKSREKLIIQDKIWKGICKEVGWRFIPSV